MKPMMAELLENICRWQAVKLWLKSIVYCVKRNGASVGSYTADDSVRHTVLGSHVLWAVGEFVHNPAYEVLINSCVLHHLPQECRLYDIESTGEIKEPDPQRLL